MPCGNLYHTGSDFMNTQVLYVSGTGNTAAVAKEIFQALPSSSKDIQELDHAKNPLSADSLFYRLGPTAAQPMWRFWTFYLNSTEKK